MNYIYSYRITYFGGTAPCYDNDLLSLAICKKDMRRVMGRNYNCKKNNDKYWFIGLIGCALSDDSNSPFTEDDKGRILYIAKLTDVKTFEEYFSENKYKNRKDRIYKESLNGKYNTLGSNKHFDHIDSINVHSDVYSQNRDWDVQHDCKENYVLLSKEYAFVDVNTAKKIEQVINTSGKLANGVGHTWFETEDNSEIVSCLESALKKAGKEHGNDILPEELKIAHQCGCGKDKS